MFNLRKFSKVSKLKTIKFYNSQKLDTISNTLCQAAANGDLITIKKLLEENKDTDINKGDYDYRTPLHLAAAEGKLEAVKFLIERGAKVNALDRFKNTPIQDALRSSHHEVVEYLQKMGAKSFYSIGDKVNMMMSSIQSGDKKLLQNLLLVSPELINAIDYDRKSALHLAAQIGNLEIVSFLLDKGADINALDNSDQAPIHEALRSGHTEVVSLLISKGAQISSNVLQVVRTPEFALSLRKSLPILCERGRFQYAEAWILQKGGKTLSTTQDYYVDDLHLSQVSRFRSTSESAVINNNDKTLVGRVFQSKKPEFIEVIKQDDVGNFDVAKQTDIISAFAIPVVYEGTLLSVITLYSIGEQRSISEKRVSNLTDFTNYLVRIGVPGLVTKSKAKYEQMDEVIQLMSKEGAFDPTHVYYEVERFYNSLGMPQEYFAHFPSKTIAKHISSLIASKKVAQTSGKRENISFVNESPESAYYLCAASKDKINAIESLIEEYILATPKNYCYMLDSYQSSGTIISNGNDQLRLYVVKRFLKEPSTSTKLEDLTSYEFVKNKKESTLAKYQEIITEANDRLNPVFKTYEPDADGHIHVMLGFQRSSDKTYLGSFTEIIESIKGMKCSKKYCTSFSNGLVIYSLFVAPEKVDDVQQLLNKSSLLSIIPPTKLYTLFLQRKITARQLMYYFSVAKFCFYFTQRTSEEYQLLAKHLANDHVNLGRLFAIQNKLKRDSLPEQRIIDTVFNYLDLMHLIFVDFAKIASGEKKPAYNTELEKRIKKSVYDSVDQSILTSFLTFNAHLLKTNFYKFEKAAISYRLDPSFLKNTNYPEVPFGLFLVIGSDFMGFHCRFRDVARGGIRVIKSANPQAYAINTEGLFTEGYGLANTQQRKNKDIPEGGSKGTILLYQNDQTHTVTAFQKYVDSLLDLLLKNKDVIDHYGKEEILFLGPDENTANVMDWAALHAKKRGYGFWKAFTTGKGQHLGGIPHDIFGMTTQSIHEYVLGIYEKLGLDETQIRKLTTGGPDGDLGGNEILISKDKTLVIVDGSGVLYDPNGINREELKRLVKEKQMISGFNTKYLSEGGFRVLIEENDVKLPSGEVVENGMSFRNNFHLHTLFQGDLFVPCGGRPASVNISNVDKFFINDKPKVKYIVEGANLFFTQDARLVLEEAGVILFKDATANKGGVTSSSMEVLAALSFSNSEFAEHMQVKENGEYPEFYKIYVNEVIRKVKHNARSEFNCIWNENQKTGISRSKLSDLISNKINSLNDKIRASDLWQNKPIVNVVMKEALPKPLLEKLGLETIMKRVPDNYLAAIFSCYLASNYVYKFGLEATEFDFFEFMQNYVKESLKKEEQTKTKK